jgi:hypothetical protein
MSGFRISIAQSCARRFENWGSQLRAVVRDEVEPCIGAGLRSWFEGDAKEAQFFILRYAQDWKTIYRLLAHPAVK